ncbi:hypothetical protein FC83_GL001341 [Agrilactobacillus composti DSM 18527 = JCM 14202]|uniref:Uncharacterized protein n=1 Tax=Agrilactobacillus composti DSM 18527 = JCM 14202 TaxID=1423734 RepID=X0QMC0_9LACO|nr:hypothetical protein [Agrilactobacillus composti]KRM30783.1 hypothetical protein FC83_GL001341 [Agrilactobacillus composti DSM 18527 = JCM 14202]GAF39775.1 hypothetical protein JCM14202_1650 [Agrilactobacillus composti DSM 18527 = JCM 14202]
MPRHRYKKRPLNFQQYVAIVSSALATNQLAETISQKYEIPFTYYQEIVATYRQFGAAGLARYVPSFQTTLVAKTSGPDFDKLQQRIQAADNLLEKRITQHAVSEEMKALKRQEHRQKLMVAQTIRQQRTYYEAERYFTNRFQRLSVRLHEPRYPRFVREIKCLAILGTLEQTNFPATMLFKIAHIRPTNYDQWLTAHGSYLDGGARQIERLFIEAADSFYAAINRDQTAVYKRLPRNSKRFKVIQQLTLMTNLPLTLLFVIANITPAQYATWTAQNP